MLRRDAEDVIREVLSGHQEAFRRLVEQHSAAVFRVVRRLLGDVPESEDVAQEVFLSAFSRLARFAAQRGSFATWLLTIARNKCLNRVQKKRATLLGPSREFVEGGRTGDDDDLREVIDRALGRLPVEHSTVFVLVELEQLS